MTMPKSTKITAGVDVGGPRKGFHAVVLKSGAFLAQFQSNNHAEMAEWLIAQKPRFIGIDSPCQWRTGEKPRLAETELAHTGIRCFFTPHRSEAINHPTGYYNWMLQGEKLYQLLQPDYPVFRQKSNEISTGRYCFETYPYAIACRLSGRILKARNKLADRAELLHLHDIQLPDPANIDFIDAALCALMANLVSPEQYQATGDDAGGHILLPLLTK